MELKKGLNVIIGWRATGKTLFIKNKLLRSTPNSLVFDMHSEYKEINDAHKIKLFTNLPIKERIETVIRELKKDRSSENVPRTFYFEDIYTVFNFKNIGENEIRLRDVIKDKGMDLYFVFQNYRTANRFIDFIGGYDYAYIFKTIDRPLKDLTLDNKYESIAYIKGMP